MELAGPAHPMRAALEGFVVDRFAAAYGARIRRHYPVLAAVLDPAGAPRAVAGLRFADDEPLFLERYLDTPVEQAVAGAFGQPVCREQIVEIGSLASDAPEASLQLFASLSEALGTRWRRRFAVATARPELQRLLGRAGFGLNGLGRAEPARLGPDADDWGSYYARPPQVLAGEIAPPAALPALHERLRERLLARALRSAAQ